MLPIEHIWTLSKKTELKVVGTGSNHHWPITLIHHDALNPFACFKKYMFRARLKQDAQCFKITASPSLLLLRSISMFRDRN